MANSTTLRDLMKLDNQPPLFSESTLIMIDFQNTYRSGVMKLEGAEEALGAATQLLARARDSGNRVIHILNDGGEGTPYDIHATIGQISDEVTPLDGETVIVKTFPNAFVGTELEARLREEAGKDLILAGFMTHMCVNYTAQGAFNLGFRPTVVADATATRTLSGPDGSSVPAAALQTASLTAITDLFGVVVATTTDIPA